MNIYALIPLIATITYIPLLVMTISNRPWRRQHQLFILLLVPSIMWSLVDFFFRANFFPENNFIMLKVISIMFAWTAVQLHCFTSSFFPRGQDRWLPFAYVSLAGIVVLTLMGYDVHQAVTASGDKLFPEYGTVGIIYQAVPLMTLLARNLWVFGKMVRASDNPVLHNQISYLRLTVIALAAFTMASLLPWGKEYPIPHIGNMMNALILSYATIGHHLVDIKLVIRRGLAWVILVVIGFGFYWVLLVLLRSWYSLQMAFWGVAAGTAATVVAVGTVYKLRGFFFEMMSRAFQGESFSYRQRLYDFANEIHAVFSFKEQGGELLSLIINAVGCSRAALLFVEVGGSDFSATLVEPNKDDNPLSRLRLRGDNPVVAYLRHKHKPLTMENLSILPEFRGLWELEKEEMKSSGVDLFVPLISRNRLIGILAVDKKRSGWYSLEDYLILEDVTNRSAVSMEKEYLREELKEREKELSIINRSSAIITSSLDIQPIYDTFIQELKNMVSVDWAAIRLIEEDTSYFLALSSPLDQDWKIGQRLPFGGSGLDWVASHRKSMVEPDLAVGRKFESSEALLRGGLRSIVRVPLFVNDKVIGALMVASKEPNAYSQRQLKLLEELTAQIAMPIENSRLYARAEELARLDELTGLLNRRSLDEMMTSEIARHLRYGGVFSIIIFDFDSFKIVNDHYGHLSGDNVLRDVGAVLRDAIRKADQAFRYGGDEFAVLLPQTGIDEAMAVAERIRERIQARMVVGQLVMTASLGVASWPADGAGPNEVLSAADTALYLAKRGGGNRTEHPRGTPLPVEYQVAGVLKESAAPAPAGFGDSDVLSTICSLAAAVDAGDQYTSAHSKRVNEYAVALAEALNLEPLEVSRVSACSLLHDIGKIGISYEILNKPSKLTAEEWRVVRSHPQLGASIVSHVPQLAHCIPGILHHHERYDGSGYPNELKGEEIPLEARILAIADAFAAMTSSRSYSKALSFEEALEELKLGAGKQFAPNLVETFARVIRVRLVVKEQVRR